MPEVQGVNSINYQLPVQTKKSYSEDIIPNNDVNEFEEPAYVDKEKSGNAGLTLLGLAVAAGLGIMFGHSLRSGKIDALKEENTKMVNVMKELKREADKYADKFVDRHMNSQSFVKNVSNKTEEFVAKARRELAE